MNELKLRIKWYIKFLLESKAFFFLMLSILIFWLLFSNFYINKNYINEIQVYEDNISEVEHLLVNEDQPSKKKDNDLYSFISILSSKNNVDIRSFSMSQKIAVFSLVGSTNQIKDIFFEINKSVKEKEIFIEKADFSFEDDQHTVLNLEVRVNEE